MNNQKLIMENWRRFINESVAMEQQELDEGMKEKMFAALMGVFALGASGEAEAGGATLCACPGQELQVRVRQVGGACCDRGGWRLGRLRGDSEE